MFRFNIKYQPMPMNCDQLRSPPLPKIFYLVLIINFFSGFTYLTFSSFVNCERDLKTKFHFSSQDLNMT